MSTIGKTLRLLDLFTSERSAIGLSEFQRLTGTSKATLHRHLQALLRAGFLEQDRRTSAYSLGPALSRLAAQREQGFSMRDTVKPVADALSRKVAELVHVSVFDGQTMRAIYHAQHHDHGLRVQFEDAEFIPLHATSSGTALAAFLPQSDWSRLMAPPLQEFTARTVTEPDAIVALLTQIRARGHSEMSETRETGVSSIGAPIFDATGAPRAAISITYPTHRNDAVRARQAVQALRNAAAQITAAIGGANDPAVAAG